MTWPSQDLHRGSPGCRASAEPLDYDDPLKLSRFKKISQVHQNLNNFKSFNKGFPGTFVGKDCIKALTSISNSLNNNDDFQLQQRTMLQKDDALINTTQIDFNWESLFYVTVAEPRIHFPKKVIHIN